MRKRPAIDRFWEKVDRKDDPSACWEWQGAKGGNGYGRFHIASNEGKGAWTYAHRFSYELARGSIGSGLNICHSCDNPRCCNPNHLFIGTQGDNMRDASRKKRWPATNPRTQLLRKITDRADIAAIIASRKAGTYIHDIATKYGVSTETIRRLLKKHKEAA